MLGLIKDGKSVSQTFDFSSQGYTANEPVTIKFKLILDSKQSTSTNLSKIWDNSDDLTIEINGNSYELIQPTDSEVVSGVNISGPNINGEYNIEIATTLAGGELDISLVSDTGNSKVNWAMDDFEIIATSENEIVTFDSNSAGEINMLEILSQANDFENNGGSVVSNPTSLDEIDLSASGDHILSNINVDDVLAMTDSDNMLKILGNASDSDEIKLDSAQWQATGNPGEYENKAFTPSGGGATITAGTVKILVEDVDVTI